MAKVKGIFTAESVKAVINEISKYRHINEIDLLPDEIGVEDGKEIWIYEEAPTELLRYEISRIKINSTMPVFMQNNVELVCLNEGLVSLYIGSHLREFGYEPVERKRRIM